VKSDGDLDVPPGSTAVKTFLVDGKRIETRLFVRYDDGSYAGYSYEWNDDQSDATLLPDGKTKDLPGGKSWTFPSRADCFACHTQIAGFTLGLEARQLNTGDQIDRLARLFDRPIDKESFPTLPAADGQASDEQRARGYLHANCSICHREGSGAGAATLDLRIDQSFADTKTCNVAPQAGDLGVADAKLIAPGDPAKSTLALRMRSLDPVQRMPNVATRLVDDRGVAAVEAWIRSVAACP
jgi:mono/diheme cytochrome c family protein